MALLEGKPIYKVRLLNNNDGYSRSHGRTGDVVEVNEYPGYSATKWRFSDGEYVRKENAELVSEIVSESVTSDAISANLDDVVTRLGW